MAPGGTFANWIPRIFIVYHTFCVVLQLESKAWLKQNAEMVNGDGTVNVHG